MLKTEANQKYFVGAGYSVLSLRGREASEVRQDTAESVRTSLAVFVAEKRESILINSTWIPPVKPGDDMWKISPRNDEVSLFMKPSKIFSNLISEKGVSLIEILVALILISVISIASFQYFSSGMGFIGREGYRRAALEKARQRLEQLLAANVSSISPTDTALHWLQCTGGGPTCTWAMSGTEPSPAETVAVEDLPSQTIQTTVQFLNDPAAGTVSAQDVLDLGVKVWYTNSSTDNDFNRVYVRTLRSA